MVFSQHGLDKELARFVRAAHERPAGYISKTNFLLSGEGGGSKRTKAESLGIPVIDEIEINKMLKS